MFKKNTNKFFKITKQIKLAYLYPKKVEKI